MVVWWFLSVMCSAMSNVEFPGDKPYSGLVRSDFGNEISDIIILVYIYVQNVFMQACVSSLRAGSKPRSKLFAPALQAILYARNNQAKSSRTRRSESTSPHLTQLPLHPHFR